MSLVERARRKRAWMRYRRAGVRQLETPYLNWMSFATAGMLHPGNRYLIDLAVRELPSDDPVLEIGSLAGLSANTITYFLQRHGRPNQLFTTDPWVLEGEGSPTVPESDIAFTDYRALIRAQFERNVRFWNGDRLPHSFALSSDDFFAAWAGGETRADVFGRETPLGGSLAFAYVDGDHSYEQVWRDFENVDRLLVPGGLIFFDDSDQFGEDPQVYDAVQDVLASHPYDVVGQNPYYLLRKRS